MHPFILEGIDELGKFAQRKPMDRGSATGFNLRESLFLDGGNYYFQSLRARGVEDKEGELAVAGDEAEFVGSRQG
jgi:hypothetical protein